MRNTYNIDGFQYVQTNLHFSLNETGKERQFQPVGQVLTDSDDFSFIYIVEEDGQYSYIKFSKNFWPQLVELLKKGQNPYLKIGDLSIELIHFNEELESLIFNIEGNDNYGNDFVSAVESVFEPILKSEL